MRKTVQEKRNVFMQELIKLQVLNNTKIRKW